MSAKRTTITVPPELREEIRRRQKGRDTAADVIAREIGRPELSRLKTAPQTAPEGSPA